MVARINPAYTIIRRAQSIYNMRLEVVNLMLKNCQRNFGNAYYVVMLGTPLVLEYSPLEYVAK